MILEYIIVSYERKGEFTNTSSIYILLNCIYINISSGSSSRFMDFFVKKTEPFYKEQNCLLMALLIQNLEPGNIQTLKLILEIIKQLIVKIEQRTKNTEVKNTFVREVIEAYRQNKNVFQPEYIICLVNWIHDNKYGERKLTLLFRAVQKHRKNIKSLERLQELLLRM